MILELLGRRRVTDMGLLVLAMLSLSWKRECRGTTFPLGFYYSIYCSIAIPSHLYQKCFSLSLESDEFKVTVKS